MPLSMTRPRSVETDRSAMVTAGSQASSSMTSWVMRSSVFLDMVFPPLVRNDERVPKPRVTRIRLGLHLSKRTEQCASCSLYLRTFPALPGIFSLALRSYTSNIVGEREEKRVGSHKTFYLGVRQPESYEHRTSS